MKYCITLMRIFQSTLMRCSIQSSTKHDTNRMQLIASNKPLSEKAPGNLVLNQFTSDEIISAFPLRIILLTLKEDPIQQWTKHDSNAMQFIVSNKLFWKTLVGDGGVEGVSLEWWNLFSVQSVSISNNLLRATSHKSVWFPMLEKLV